MEGRVPPCPMRWQDTGGIRRRTRAAGLALLLAASGARAYDWDSYRVEDFEEPAGSASLIECSPTGRGTYGVGLGSGTWLAGTPVFGDYAVSLFWNDIEDAWYGNVGMTLRLMPHWKVAPFVGGGGAYNRPLGSGGTNDASAASDTGAQAEAYWAGIAEAGIRVYAGRSFYEILGRQVWSSAKREDSDYWTIRLAIGLSLGRRGRDESSEGAWE
jgi:hypothetical protein